MSLPKRPSSGRTPEAITEKEMRWSITKAAQDLGWLVSFAWTSIHSPRGLPDLTLVHPATHRLMYFELKSAKGKVTEPQQQWLDALASCPGVIAMVIFPKDLETAYKLLVEVKE